MIRKKLMLLAALSIAAFSASTTASATNVAVTGDVGTTGTGIHFTVPVAKDLNARFGVNYFDFSHSASTNNVNYDFKLKLNTWDALLDYHPFSSGFRLTGGLIYNANKIDAHAKPNGNGTYTLNGNVYSSATAGNVDGSVDFRKLAPYVGLGYSSPIDQPGWGLSADAGVIFQGNPSTSLSNSNCSASAAACAQLARDVAAENQSLNDKVHNYQYYPVVRIGLMYRW